MLVDQMIADHSAPQLIGTLVHADALLQRYLAGVKRRGAEVLFRW